MLQLNVERGAQMFKTGCYYITAKGRLAKVVSTFKVKDEGNVQIAVQCPGQGWFPSRLKDNGTSIDNADHNTNPEDDFKGFLTFCKIMINYDRVTKTWAGGLYDLTNTQLIVLTGIESQERVLKLLQLGAQEKILTWMQETGYVDEEMDEGAE
jgi:hypothetical protein